MRYGWVLVIGLNLVLAPVVLARTWTTADGNSQVEAELQSLEGDTVVLRRDSDGKVLRVPLAKFSEADRKFLAEQKPAPAPEKTPPAAVLRLPRPAAKGEARLPLPDVEAQRQAEAAVQALFDAELTAAKVKLSRMRIARKMRAASADGKQPPAVCFALLRNGAIILADCGQLQEALELAEATAAKFDVHLAPTLAALAANALEAAGAALRETDIQQTLSVIDRCTAEGRFDLVRKLAEQLRVLAVKEQEHELVKAMQTRVTALPRVQKEFDDFQAALRTLEDQPNDAAASLAVGRFVCLVANQWSVGLPYLSKGADVQWSELARRELAIKPDAADGAELKSLGESWAQRAEKLPDPVGGNVRAHAAELYRQALPGLEEEARSKLEETISDLAASKDRRAVPARKGSKKIATAPKLELQIDKMGSTSGGMQFSPDSQFLVSASGNRVAMLDVVRMKGGGFLEITPLKSIQRISVHPVCGTVAVSGYDGETWKTFFCDVLSQAVEELPTPEEEGGHGVCFSPDGSLLATWGEKGTRLWDVSTMEKKEAAPNLGAWLDISRDNGWIAGGGGHGAVQVWDIKNRRRAKGFTAGGGGVRGITFSPDSSLLALGNYEDLTRIWLVKEQKFAEPLKHQAKVAYGACWFSDGKHLATTSGPNVNIWDMEKRQIVASAQAAKFEISRVTVSPDGKFLATAGDSGPGCLWRVTGL